MTTTLVLDRTITHYHVKPLDRSGDCLACGADGGAGSDGVADLGNGPVLLWSGTVCCFTYYTTDYDRPVCPDGHAWCVDHEVDDEGVHWHRTASTYMGADEDGYLNDDDAAVLELVGVTDVAPNGGPVVWLKAAGGMRHARSLEDGGIGYSPDRARQLGLQLIQLANKIEGGEPR